MLYKHTLVSETPSESLKKAFLSPSSIAPCKQEVEFCQHWMNLNTRRTELSLKLRTLEFQEGSQG